MDAATNDLLCRVPESADYAVDATDLDPEDIPQSRVDGVRHLLFYATDDAQRFLAARLLASWGYHEGLVELERHIDEYEKVAGTFTHRMYGYDDTGRQVLMAVIKYFANVADRGDAQGARAQIYVLIEKLILLANRMPFEISRLFDFVRSERAFEYLPLLERHLQSIIDYPEVHGWKIKEVIELLLDFDAEFALALLRSKGKALEDFNF